MKGERVGVCGGMGMSERACPRRVSARLFSAPALRPALSPRIAPPPCSPHAHLTATTTRRPSPDCHRNPPPLT